MSIIGFTCGSFDLFHVGHISMLRWCRERCTHLVVGLQTDPSIDRPEKNKPVQSMYERYAQLSASKYASEIMPYETEADLLNLLACEQFQVRFIGDEYIDTEFTGKEVCEQVGTTIVFTPRRHTFSSFELRRRIRMQEHTVKKEAPLAAAASKLLDKKESDCLQRATFQFPEWAPGISRKPNDDEVHPLPE